MPASRIVHFNPPGSVAVACNAHRVIPYWSKDPKDVSCDRCRRTKVWRQASEGGKR